MAARWNRLEGGDLLAIGSGAWFGSDFLFIESENNIEKCSRYKWQCDQTHKGCPVCDLLPLLFGVYRNWHDTYKEGEIDSSIQPRTVATWHQE